MTASTILRKLAAYPRQNRLATALRELGRLERTIFTLDFLCDIELRRRIQAGLNKGEARNALARAVFFNRLGELRDRTYENQQHRTNGLSLVVAAIVLWNTVYLEKAIQKLKRVRGKPFRRVADPPLTTRLGAHQPDRRLCLAARRWCPEQPPPAFAPQTSTARSLAYNTAQISKVPLIVGGWGLPVPRSVFHIPRLRLHALHVAHLARHGGPNAVAVVGHIHRLRLSDLPRLGTIFNSAFGVFLGSWFFFSVRISSFSSLYPVLMLLAKDRPQRLGFIRMIRPAKYAYTARLVRLQPYDPNKIPVLMIHGLQDTPATWAPLLNELRSDHQINQQYQFWVYNYPSDYPFPYSAELLREELDRVDKTYPDHKKIILIGHSMGGLVARLMVTDSNLLVWNDYFDKPPDAVPMDPEAKKFIERLLIFQHRPEVGRVIFISTPHRGSEIASNWIGRLGIALVKLPANLTKTGTAVMRFETKADADVQKPNRLHFPTSIDTLSPNKGFVLALNALPIVSHIPYHSIIGDRGRGDTPNSSDGVVAYWSSHLARAQSERIVPSDHGAHQNKEGMEEVHRILLLNLTQ